MAEDWLDHVTIRLLREEDLPALEWDGEYIRYRKVYQEVYRNSQRGISLPYVAETPEDGIIGQVFLTRKDPNPSYSPRSRSFFLSCSSDNDRARRFYEKHGFRIVRLDEGKWSYVNHEGLVVSERQSAYLMRKTLPRFFFK